MPACPFLNVKLTLTVPLDVVGVALPMRVVQADISSVRRRSYGLGVVEVAGDNSAAFCRTTRASTDDSDLDCGGSSVRALYFLNGRSCSNVSDHEDISF